WPVNSSLFGTSRLPALSGFGSALYKRWIPDTNYENSSNWDRGRVPCGTDRVVFLPEKKVSVYVESSHSILDLNLPRDAEFIFGHDAEFAASRGAQDPGCDGGTITFRDPDAHQWYDPTLWQAAVSEDDLDTGHYLFTVHEESVPCHHDSVLFRSQSSFRVGMDSDDQSIILRSISVLGTKFINDKDFQEFLKTNTGKLQFPDLTAIRVTNERCREKSGCECGNSANHNRICANLLRHSECPAIECKEPLNPVGHCCPVCGATLTLQYTETFDLELYRSRLQHLYLNTPMYSSIQMAMSKVPKAPAITGLDQREAATVIQVLLLDQETGENTGRLAVALAMEIMKDINSQGATFGITKGEIQTATGSGSERHTGGMTGGAIAGTVITLLLLLLGFASLVALFMRGSLRFPTLPFLKKADGDMETLGGPIDKGFDNPIFDTDMPTNLPGLYSTNEALKTVSYSSSGVHFVNPVYDETEFNI
ncbi:protein amnionless, partial [Erpetoichthys calabaricus]|uniref:protein amnionless n=1 Tax=Erpetoichthys calabaricus TaxID=27687 RepID=UPI0022341E8F